jgi:hypothetical protein
MAWHPRDATYADQVSLSTWRTVRISALREREDQRDELAVRLADGRRERAERLARTSLLDVALHGRRAVFTRASRPNRKGEGKPYREQP